MMRGRRWVMAAVAGVLALGLAGAGAGAARPAAAGEQVRVLLPAIFNVGQVGHWVTIYQDDFEAGFPGAHWGLFEFGPNDYRWNTRTCDAHSPTHSLWAIGGGADGNALACGAAYQNNLESWVVYGPFDLSDATAADYRYQAIFNSQLDQSQTHVLDGVCNDGSADGINFGNDLCWGGNTAGGWVPVASDLAVGNHPNLLGDSSVWIAMIFFSDGSVTHPTGAEVDDFLLRKCVGGPCQEPAAGAAAGAGVVAEAGPRVMRLGR